MHLFRRRSREDPETQYAAARAAMVQDQIVARGVRDPRVIEAMRAAPRHRFVPESAQREAYADHPLPIGQNQTISQPYMVAMMTELLDPRPEDRVLEIGTGSGYQTAVLACLAREVVSIERFPDLAETAARRLSELGYANARVITGDGTLGHPEGGPFDAILVTAGSPQTPPALEAQLAVGGRLVCPVGPRDMQRIQCVTRSAEGFVRQESIRCMFVPLIGAAGWTAP